ncbi:MAG: PhzF family phenazine biosynthesis protein [Lewinellaceae bacterium]|nr:PhzF family phenazine biosynthesis protein [Lewinellaceae bacterium]
MNTPIFQVDAFADQLFEGNPAAVCLLDHWPDDAVLQAIGMENNLSETAFLVPKGDIWELRWFTPAAEVDLCGHATLASAHVLFSHFKVSSDQVVFTTKKHGLLTVKRMATGYSMDFPADPIQPVPIPEGLSDVLGIEPREFFEGRDDWMAVVDAQTTIENLEPDFQKLKKLGKRGLIVTAPGREVDFVSRCFFPQYGIDEDPVTGSAHTTLAPYWAQKLHKTELVARQLSKRGGTVICRLKGDRVELEGKAVTFFEGLMRIGQ